MKCTCAPPNILNEDGKRLSGSHHYRLCPLWSRAIRGWGNIKRVIGYLPKQLMDAPKCKTCNLVEAEISRREASGAYSNLGPSLTHEQVMERYGLGMPATEGKLAQALWRLSDMKPLEIRNPPPEIKEIKHVGWRWRDAHA